MPLNRLVVRAAAVLVFCVASLGVRGDELRNVKRGEPVPACKLPAVSGAVVDSEALKGKVIVYVCLSAEQKRSELAAAESQQVVSALTGEPVVLLHVTADVVQKTYFEKQRQEHAITGELLLDADRAFYGKLGLIAFPTTIVVDKEGRLSNVISLHGSDYKATLDAYVRFALGKITEKELAERLQVKAAEPSSPRSAASAHRALAHLLRQKGQDDAARAELEKGLALDPESTETMLDMADLDFAMDKTAAAEATVDKVIGAQPEHRRAKALKGACLFRGGKLDEAASVLESALPLNPNPEVVHYYLGLIAEKKGEKEKAIEHFREGLKLLIDRSSGGAAK
ncbi:MAG: tetratricopeptide repeat protein [Phycisphaerales bacterium]